MKHFFHFSKKDILVLISSLLGLTVSVVGLGIMRLILFAHIAQTAEDPFSPLGPSLQIYQLVSLFLNGVTLLQPLIWGAVVAHFSAKTTQLRNALALGALVVILSSTWQLSLLSLPLSYYSPDIPKESYPFLAKEFNERRLTLGVRFLPRLLRSSLITLAGGGLYVIIQERRKGRSR